jgi:hypothetical protein
MKLGFSGTAKGMTDRQYAAVETFVVGARSQEGEGLEEAHHGDCVGADLEFHGIVMFRAQMIYVHPPSDPKARAWTSNAIILPPKPYLARNKDIVDSTDVLLAAPEGEERSYPRSGTWATVRYAKARGKLVLVVYP